MDKPFMMPVEDVFSIKGRGTVVTGRIDRGKIKVGEPVEIVGLRDKSMSTVVTGVEMFHKTLNEGMAGDNAGLLLKNVTGSRVSDCLISNDREDAGDFTPLKVVGGSGNMIVDNLLGGNPDGDPVRTADR